MLRVSVYVAIGWTIVLIVLGAYVRLSDAGLGCPDWPGCYGHAVLPLYDEALAKAQMRYPQQKIEVGKAWKEMIHRYVAGGLGVLIVSIILILLVKRKALRQGSGLPLLLGTILVLQATLGMWTVTLLLKPAIVTAHLLGGMLMLALLVLLGVRQTRALPWVGPHCKEWALLAWILVWVQIALGGWVSSNYAALACHDFPGCRVGEWWPAMDFEHAFHLFRDLGRRADGDYLTLANLTAIHWVHRLGALLAGVVILKVVTHLLCYRVSFFWGMGLLGLLVLQITLGIGNIVFVLPLVTALAHNGTAALLLAVLTLINAHLWRTDHLCDTACAAVDREEKNGFSFPA